MTTNITVFEFSLATNGQGEAIWPASVVTTGTQADTIALGAATSVILVTSDADCRAMINASGVSTAAGVSTIPILSGVPNQFTITPGSGQTLKFA